LQRDARLLDGLKVLGVPRNQGQAEPNGNRSYEAIGKFSR
jgi:hypothetical protein